MIVFWQIWSKSLFLMELVYYGNFVTYGKRCLMDEVPFPSRPDAVALARGVKC